MDTEESAPVVSSETPAAYMYLLDSRSQNNSQQLLPLRDREIFKIGRDPRSNTLAIDNDPDYAVSRNHCEVYVVMYEPTINHIYVRDRKSSNGTYVNGQLIGMGPRISPGYLLQHGDVIEIRPYWTLTLVQDRAPPRHDLDSLQAEECKLFSDKYLMTNRCLGQGAEAIVHLAVDVVTRKQLVCKLVNLDKIQGNNSREELRRKFQEADLLRQLRHPNVLPYVDAISSPHSLYTFTELASGGDLMSFIYRQNSVKEFDARIIIRQVVRGLGYLHGKGIVHRDLKPENILLAYSPKIAYHRIMIADFGNSAVPRRSRMVTNVGTVNYQAPEFLTGAQAHTSAVDIWSLGIVVLVLLAASSDTEIEDINRKDQNEIEQYLKSTFADMDKQPSRNGKKFLWGCLQKMPSARMKAMDAEFHDWLRTPEKHLRFFQLLDRKMMSEWEPHDELTPMPWELPSLRNNPIAATKESETRFSQYFATEATSIVQPGPLAIRNNITGNDQDNAISEKETPGEDTPEQQIPEEETPQQQVSEEEMPEKGMLPPSVPELESSSSIIKRTVGPLRPKDTVKQLQLPWHGSRTPTRPVQPEYRAKRPRTSRIKSRDVLHPLPGLDRHLKPSHNRHHRQQVLQELEKSKTKFLVELDGIIPSTPQDATHRRHLTPQAPKRQISVRNQGLVKLAGQDHLDVPRIAFR
ncbi:hypothetical protein QQZ08_004538 [Neonectria magnoliae]|uniref:CAMK protein kinase n=1 Tax=Neonectria magnoliae TaxID=2732573 RepID=A0ABR1I6T1_9HYPO